MSNVLLFGSSGQIGSEIKEFFLKNNSRVYCVKRSIDMVESEYDIYWDVFSSKLPSIKSEKFSSICFAQGLNLNDSVYDFDYEKHIELYKVNSLLIVIAINKLLRMDLLERPAKICIISSVWQDIARQDKMSYCISKSSLRGLVNSLSVDLGKEGHLINAILPGAIDTEMTRANLSENQLKKITDQTFFKKLSDIKDIAKLCYFLCGNDNSSITGQFINIDLGFSNAKII